jgi:hypothetical protein
MTLEEDRIIINKQDLVSITSVRIPKEAPLGLRRELGILEEVTHQVTIDSSDCCIVLQHIKGESWIDVETGDVLRIIFGDLFK